MDSKRSFKTVSHKDLLTINNKNVFWVQNGSNQTQTIKDERRNFSWRRGVEDDKLDISKLLNVPPGLEEIAANMEHIFSLKINTRNILLCKSDNQIIKPKTQCT